MRIKIFIFIIFAAAFGVSAQSKLTLKQAGFGKITIAKQNLRAVVDLSKDIAGCVYVTGKNKRELDKIGCTASPATFRLIDAQTVKNQHFLIVLSEGAGRCNVCGQCGASDAFTLVWLKLDARLRVLDKKSVPVEYCLENISIVSPDYDVEANTNERLALKFADDVLRVEFEKRKYGETESEENYYEFTTLEYNRKTPEKGFVIKIEKRKDSSTEE